MTRGRLLFILLSVALLAPLVSGALSRAATEASGEPDSLYKHLSVFTEVLSLVKRNYVEETSDEDLFAGAMYGTMDALGPLSLFVPASRVEDFERSREIGERRSGVTLVKDRGNPWILSVAPGGPGEVAGLRRGDLLAEIDGVPARGLPLWDLRARFAGQPGTRLALRIQRLGRGETIELTLAPYEPPPPSVERSEGLPVLRLHRFTPQTAERVRPLLADLAAAGGEDRLLIDLRGAAGGSVEEAFAVAGLFSSGPLGSLRDRTGAIDTWTGAETPVWSGRLVVLTDRGCQGASEILASVLRQSAGAELVGERTFGHAGRQTVIELSTGARALITDAYYAGPDGEILDDSLEPDEAVSESSRSFAEADVPLEDLILRRGLERLRSAEASRRAA